jgi:type IV pilus assembly protein PilO
VKSPCGASKTTGGAESEQRQFIEDKAMTSVRKIVFFVLLVGVACIAYKFMIKPANKHLAEQKAQLDVKLAKLDEFEDASSAAEGLNKQVEQLAEAVEFFESKLPPTSEIDKVLRDVTVISEKQGLKPKSIRTLKRKDNSGYVEQPIKMELVGNFKSFYSFLLELEKLPRIMKIRQLEVEKAKTLEGQITTDFVVSIFFQNAAG